MSAPRLAKLTTGRIEKEILKKRISNNECRRNVFCLFYKKAERSDSENPQSAIRNLKSEIITRAIS
ncbi:hypothetical protein JY97_02155 [Alkalispirochaeta odontotermitis]|nr:hypothetical protein JY97_02155 [Alkalispirochaeta odontotermitis]